MRLKQLLLFCMSLINSILSAQSVTGSISSMARQEVKLEGFDGLNTYTISTTISDDKGNFKLIYSKENRGIGFIQNKEGKPFWIILDNEDVNLEGESLSDTKKVKIVSGEQNLLLNKFAAAHTVREHALNAWSYLDKIYTRDSTFVNHKKTKSAIKTAINSIHNEESRFIEKIHKDAYLSWYLPNRKFISTISSLVQLRREEIPTAIKIFRQLDYSDSKLYTSGLLKDAIESHFWLLENSGMPLDKIYEEMRISIDSLIYSLVKDEKKLNIIVDYLFDLLERHSLFSASEHLALKVLTEVNCSIDNDIAKQLESYRAMKKGNLATEILFNDYTVIQNKSTALLPQKLSDLKSKYTIIVFGASWCPKCNEEIPQIVDLYKKWKANDIEVIFISLDEDNAMFQKFTANFPFLSICDFKKWKSKVVNDYFVFATPTIYILNSKREIVLKPISINQIDAWLNLNANKQ